MIDVVGAAIVRDGRVLCAKRDAKRQLAGRWEFPGGKIEAGESCEEALAREIREELGCEVAVGEHICTSEHEYPFGRVRLAVYWCRLETGEPSASEHQELRWVEPGEMPSLTWPPADEAAVRIISETTAGPRREKPGKPGRRDALAMPRDA